MPRPMGLRDAILLAMIRASLMHRARACHKKESRTTTAAAGRLDAHSGRQFLPVYCSSNAAFNARAKCQRDGRDATGI